MVGRCLILLLEASPCRCHPLPRPTCGLLPTMETHHRIPTPCGMMMISKEGCTCTLKPWRSPRLTYCRLQKQFSKAFSGLRTIPVSKLFTLTRISPQEGTQWTLWVALIL
jgi:hypothetical protein